MKILKITKAYLAILTMLAFVFTACEKEEETSFTENRPTIIKIKDAENAVTAKARDVLPTIDNFVLIDLRRDATDAASLNQTITVKLVMDPTLIDDYNSANGTDFVELPSSAYTLSEDISNITFQPGEFVKEIRITVDKSALSLSEQYALAFTIAEASGGVMISNELRSAIYSIGIKNKWDGKYAVTGSFQDITNPAFVGIYPHEWDLVTAGANTVIVVDNFYLGFPGYVFETGAGLSFYGNFGLVVEFDPVTDLISKIWNYYGDPTKPATAGGNPAGGSGPPNYAASNTRRAVLDPTGINAYNAASKSIDIKYFMLQPNVVAAPPNIRAYFNEVWQYIGPR